MMKIQINGKELEVSDALNVAALLEERGLNQARVAVELNRAILAADAFTDTTIKDGDTLEIVQFVGGG